MADEFTKAALYGIRTFNKKVKEKIGMQKLIELLNEYIPKGWEVAHGGKSIFYEGLNYTDRVISKSFGFIKWLVENDKIDVEKVYNNSDYPMVKRDEFLYEGLLMLLAIQDEPIRFLCEIIK